MPARWGRRGLRAPLHEDATGKMAESGHVPCGSVPCQEGTEVSAELLPPGVLKDKFQEGVQVRLRNKGQREEGGKVVSRVI
mmetsp:Transcript_41158/g.128472  ORF Transcript_41158/g.128472 Transcript_41158/m.128472 type:complete len:81 (+) Transcript_41158:862-1104(+)